VSNAVAPQFVGHHSPWLTAMRLQQALEEPLGGLRISPRLQKNINHFTVLIDRTPEIVLLAPDLREDLVDEESVAIALLVAFQPFGILGAKFDAPKTNGLITDSDPPLGQEILDITSAQVEPMVEPNGVLNDLGRKSVTSVQRSGSVRSDIFFQQRLTCMVIF